MFNVFCVHEGQLEDNNWLVLINWHKNLNEKKQTMLKKV